MELIIKLLNYNKRINFTIALLVLYCLCLLLFRAKITQSIYLFFLIWNLVLAAVPYLLTSYFSKLFFKQRKTIKVILFFSWLSFLPNSFYIITDLVHIVRSKENLFYYDLVLISSFAIIGFLFGLLSMIQMEKMFEKENFSSRFINFGLALICLLNGLGIYIGRILRFNSWDIITNPIHLFTSVFYEIFSNQTVFFSLHFGVFIYMTFIIFKNIIKTLYEND